MRFTVQGTERGVDVKVGGPYCCEVRSLKEEISYIKKRRIFMKDGSNFTSKSFSFLPAEYFVRVIHFVNILLSSILFFLLFRKLVECWLRLRHYAHCWIYYSSK